MIFAAGLGTRLRPLTDNMPKALVPVHGEPLLHHVLTRLTGAGFDDIVINVHHFADMIEDYLRTSCWPDKVRISISDERDLLRDTGGGIRHAGPLLGDGNFLVHNVDIFSNLDIEAMIKGRDAGALATLLVSDRQTSRYLLFDTGGRLVGWMNVGSGEVRSPFAELKRRPQENAPFDYKEFVASHGLAMHAFNGVHLISPEIFGLMAQWPERFSIIDFYLSVCDTHKIAAYLQPGLQMVDVGKPDSLHEAESRFFPCL